MRFISPKTDFAFKKIFGSKDSEPILISFLNAMLYGGQRVIESLVIIDPYSIPRLEGMKDTYLDVRARLVNGETVLIEMQVLNVEGMEKRVLYNAAKEYANQLQKSADYTSLRPVIGLTITDFTMFPEPELEGRVINRFSLIEKEKFIQYPEGDVELVFAELPKFTTPLEELESITDKWLYFLREAGSLDVAPDSLTQVPEIEQAFGMAEFAKLSQEEERALQKKMEWIADQLALKATNQKLVSQLQKRQSELAKRQSELAKRQGELEERESELEESRSELEESRSELAKSHSELAKSQSELEESRSRLEAKDAALEESRSKQEQMLAMLREAGLSDEEIERKLNRNDQI